MIIRRGPWAIVWLLAAFLSMSSCISLRGRPAVEEGAATAVQEAEPERETEAVPSGQTQPPPEYRLGFGDILEVKFFYNAEFDQTVTIRPDGRISLPRLGDVLVVGMTPAQLDDLITKKYAEIIRDPDITVIVQEIGEEVVYVLGEVNQPGGYPLNPNGTTVLGAIALADGFKPTAKLNSVIFITRDMQGAPLPHRLNLTKAVQGSRKEDPLLTGNEIVYVPSTYIAVLNQFMDQYFYKMAPPFDFYLKVYDAIHPDRRWR